MLLKEKIREDNVNREAITEERGCKLRFKGWIRLYSVKLLGARSEDGLWEPGPGDSGMAPSQSSLRKTE